MIEPPCTERYARWCERSEIPHLEEFPPTRFGRGVDGLGEKVLNSRSFTKIFLSFERGTAPKLGGRSDDRPPRTLRAFGRQELPPSPSLSLPERSSKTCRSFKTFSPGPSTPLPIKKLPRCSTGLAWELLMDIRAVGRGNCCG